MSGRVDGTEHRTAGSSSGAAERPRSTWSDSGLEALTGRSEVPGLGPPAGLVPGVHALAASIARDSARIGQAVDVDPLAVMAARAHFAGLQRSGSVSCGGSARMLPAADGWMVISLPRPSDWELVPAWLGMAGAVEAQNWSPVARLVDHLAVDELLDRSTGLGLPVAQVGERHSSRRTHRPSTDGMPGFPGVTEQRIGASAGAADDMRELVVADLSALWAGPLVGAVLAATGAQVIKVESPWRPDGARLGSPQHFASLDVGKVPVSVDLHTVAGRHRLHRIVAESDVVITSSRHRALEQLGLDLDELVRAERPRIWVSITGYGTDPDSEDRVAFGDDAAAAGGLVVWDDQGPCFCADAVADPLAGLAAAAAVLATLAAGGEHLLVASMADVAASMVDGP